MSAKAIYEADGKELLSRYLRQTVPEENALRSSLSHKAVVVTHLSDLSELTAVSPWMTAEVSSCVGALLHLCVAETSTLVRGAVVMAEVQLISALVSCRLSEVGRQT